ncbi:MAG: response regulator [Oceanospirillaceae bacterium]|nr:response regulator [Oceanospirillaceae bacterium]
MRILVVEDHPELGSAINRAIKQMGHAVDLITDGLQAKQILQSESYDLLVLDLNLPSVDGLQVLKGFRESGGVSPVLVLTARAEVEDRVMGLDHGADDYLTKPFELVELEARIRALLRRHQSKRNLTIELGELMFDTNMRAFTLKGEVLQLTPRERSVLEVLISNSAQVVPKEVIFEKIFGIDDDVNMSAIEIYISRVRKKISGADVKIHTVRGLGYMLNCQ